MKKYYMSFANIRCINIQNYGAMKYLNIETQNGPFSQNYPPINIVDNSMADQVNYLEEFLEIPNLYQKLVNLSENQILKIEDNTLIKIGNTSSIELLYNLKNGKFFSLQAKYLPDYEDYKLLVEDFNKKYPTINNLSKTAIIKYQLILSSHAESIKDAEFLNSLKNDMVKLILHDKLKKELIDNKDKIISPKVKI